MDAPGMASGLIAWVLSGVLHVVAGGYVMYRWPQIGDKVEAGARKLFGLVAKK